MTPLYAAALAAEIAAAVTAALLARRRPVHRPAAVALVLLVALVLARVPINAALQPPRSDPWQGAARLLVYIDGAAQFGTGAAVVGLAVAVCVERPRRAVAAVVGAWALASATLAALYPSPLVRGEGLRRAYLAADLASLAASAVAFGWWRRVPRSPSSAHIVALGLVFLDVAVLVNPLGPWRTGPFGVPFDPVQATIVVGFVALAIYQGILWRFSSASL